MALTETQICSSKPKDKPYRLNDERGLYVHITPSGSKLFRHRYSLHGKENTLCHGKWPDISLDQAREKREAARKLIAQGLDPNQANADAKRHILVNRENSFEKIAREWFSTRENIWVERHRIYVIRRLETDIFPMLGHRPITTITAPELLKIISDVQERGALEVGHRVLQTCGQVFRYAIVTGRAERDITRDLKGALKPTIKRHFSYLKEADLPEFMIKLNKYTGVWQTKAAIALLILTFVRTSELRGARWEEFDFDAAIWTIPAERMKMKRSHRIPLSRQAVDWLTKIRNLNKGGDLVFPNRVSHNKSISENTILYALYRMGYHSRATGHGFRAMASTILNEMGFKIDTIEKQLAHEESNKVRACYNHAEYWEERKGMMQDWADYLDAVPSGVRSIDFKKHG